MPITQIPFQDPVAPPEKPQPEQLGLYDAQGWETAYRDLDEARVPHLLIQLQDDLTRSRRREAAWISIIVHLLLIFFLIKIEWFEKYLPWHSVVVSKNLTNAKDVTFLELPPDLQKLQHRPNTNIASDKDRIAMSRHPELDVKELRKILATPPPGAPGSSAPQMAQPPAPSSGAAQNQPVPQAQQPPNQQIAQLQTPAKPNIANEFNKYAGSMSAGSAIQQATRAAAAGRGGATWHASLSTQGPGAVNARDRIGLGPWMNAKGMIVATSVDDLHSAGNKLSKQNNLSEKGDVINGRGDTPNRHDILTGSTAEGKAFPADKDMTCKNYTSSTQGSVMLGHNDRIGLRDDDASHSWNSSHPSRGPEGGCSQADLRSTGGDGLLYCFAAN